jgi:hypothetical protein
MMTMILGYARCQGLGSSSPGVMMMLTTKEAQGVQGAAVVAFRHADT